MMITIGGCQRLTCATRLLSSFNHNLKFCRKDDVYMYKKIYTSSAVNIFNDERHENEHRKPKLWCDESLLAKHRRKNGLPRIFCQTNRNLSFAARIVEKAPQKFKPYMKLMRIDKPIGKYLIMSRCLFSSSYKHRFDV